MANMPSQSLTVCINTLNPQAMALDKLGNIVCFVENITRLLRKTFNKSQSL